MIPGSGRWVALVLVVAVLASSVVPGLAAAAVEDPRFEVIVSDPVVEPGGETTLAVQLVNDAADVEDRVRTARNVRAELRPGRTPIDVRSGPRVLGRLPDGEPRTVTFRIAVPADVAAGTYRLPIRLGYEFGRDERETTTVRARVRVEERARFAVVETGADVPIGAAGEVTLVLRNVGEAAASDASVTLESRSAALAVGDGAESRFVGAWAPGENRTLSFRARAAPTAARQRYALAARVAYDDESGNAATSRTLSTGIVPAPKQTFAVVDVTSTTAVGEAGFVTLALANRGPRTVEDATVAVASRNPALRFGADGDAAEAFVGRWRSGETKRLRVRADVAPDTAPRPYAVAATVTYERDDEQHARTLVTAVRPDPEQSFDLRLVDADLAAGDRGTVRLRVANVRGGPARDVTLVPVVANGSAVRPLAGALPIGGLREGDSATATLPVDVAARAAPGARELTVAVRYRDGAGTLRRSDSQGVRVVVTPPRDAFSVRPIDATFLVDSQGTLRVAITNERDAPVADVAATLTVAEPFESDDASAFVSRLAPNGTATVGFHLDASDDAIPTTHPVSVALTYEDDAGLTHTTAPYRIGVTVEPRPGSGLPVVPLVVVAVVLVLGLAWWWRRR